MKTTIFYTVQVFWKWSPVCVIVLQIEAECCSGDICNVKSCVHAWCLTCLKCTNIAQPRHCHSVVECFDGEVCGTEKRLSPYGHYVYDVGCFFNQTCTKQPALIDPSSSGACLECCTGDLCNVKGCGQLGYPEVRGPVCYSCPNDPGSDLCHNIDFCVQGEVCKYEGKVEFGDMIRSSKCASKHDCRQNTDFPSIIGKRDIHPHIHIETRSRELHVCDGCCETDLCNKNCSTTLHLDHCMSIKCVHGTCIDTGSRGVCTCDVGYSGSLCEIDSDNCVHQSCNHGTCVDGVDSYTCVCAQGYTGSTCDLNMDDCAHQPCYHGTCVDGIDNYTCVCLPGYTGSSCQIDIDECLHNPCHKGTCVDVLNSYMCVCSPGYTGSTCNIDIDECLHNPCHKGTCMDSVNRYTCMCPPGYTGNTCNIDIDDCYQNHCNHGTCVDGVNNYTCLCLPGYSGYTCDLDIDECYQNPCYRGTCVDGVNNYTCVCEGRYIGHQCQDSAPSDCKDVLDMNIGLTDGVYQIMLNNTNTTIDVYCDQTTDGGGWTVFQHRFNGSVDFYRNFSAYEEGFGNVFGEFWLGLKYVQKLTSTYPTQLRLDLEASDGRKAYQVFKDFSLSSGPDYTLHIGTSTGTAGDSALRYHVGQRFSTVDHDVGPDTRPCPQLEHGGWWYKKCAFANLNGEYITPGTTTHAFGGEEAVTYRDFDYPKSLKATTMMFRRV